MIDDINAILGIVASLGAIIPLFCALYKWVCHTGSEKPATGSTSLLPTDLTAKRIGAYLKDQLRDVNRSLLASEVGETSDRHMTRQIHCVSLDKRFDDLTGLRSFFCEESGGAVLLGDNGIGKSVSVQMLVQHITQLEIEKSRPDFLPALITAGQVMAEARIEGRRSQELICDDFVTSLWRKLFAPFGVGEVLPKKENRKGELLNLLGDASLIVFVDGFDEIPRSALSSVPTRKLFVDALAQVIGELGGRLLLLVSSRPECKVILTPLQLPILRLLPLRESDIAAYVERRWPKLKELKRADEVAGLVVSKFSSMPLYVKVVAEYVLKTPNRVSSQDVSRTEVLRSATESQITKNLESIGWDEDGAIQRSCLRAAAQQMHSQSNRPLPRDDLGRIALQAQRKHLGRKDRNKLLDLLRQLMHFFDEADYGLTFSHLEFRDYWLSDAIYAGLKSERVKSDGLEDLVRTVLQVPRVMEMTVDLIHSSNAESQRQMCERLITLMKHPCAVDYSDRSACSPGGAALSLFLSCRFSSDALRTHDFRDCTFQGLTAMDRDLKGLRLERACLRDSDMRGTQLIGAQLTGADLDNSNLCGANLEQAVMENASLQNCELGQHRSVEAGAASSVGAATNFRRANLEGSNWFNYRVPLDGFVQFWEGRMLDDRHLLLAISGAKPHDFWLMDLSKNESPLIARMATGHTKDVVDFDWHSDRGLFATASRDGTVRVSRLNPLVDTQSENLAVLSFFANYPRRVAFTSDGEWLAVVDRAAHVYFLASDTIHAPPKNERLPYTQHRGPIMCLETVDGDSTVFYTAGYDGMVCRFTQPDPREQKNDTRPRWGGAVVSETASSSTRMANLLRVFGWFGDRARSTTIRSLLIDSAPVTGIVEGLWIGSESGSICYHDFVRSKHCRVATPGTEVFAVTVSDDRSILAAGLSDGRILLYSVTRGRIPRLKLLRQFKMPCGDIVRRLVFLDEDERVLCLSWSGTIRIWTVGDGVPVFEYDVDSDEWRPDFDRDKLRFGPGDNIQGIQHISNRFKEYLLKLI